MLIREFISETNKNQMISRLLQYYKVGSVKLKYKSMKDFAHFDVDRGELQLSTRYKTVKKRDIEEFLTTIIHEIYHAMDAKRYGWRKFKETLELSTLIRIQKRFINLFEWECAILNLYMYLVWNN